jgi:hypothetical protein
MHRILKQAIATAVRWRMLQRNPLDDVDPPKVERRKISNSKRAAREFFCGGDSRINGNMIHAGDGDFGVAFVGP